MLDRAERMLKISSMRDKVSSEEWNARVDLAAFYRLIQIYGMSDLAANHISMRVPGEENSMLINPHGMLYEEITASSLIKLGPDGEILGKPTFGDFDYGVNRAGYVIHNAIHQSSHEIACIVHTHTWAGMAISSLECGLLPLNQTAMRFKDIGYHEFNGVVLDLAEQESLVRDLGKSSTMILRNHGLLAVGATVGETFNLIYRLELACKAQLAAMACGVPLHSVPDRIVEETFVNYQPKTRRPFGVMEWPSMLRKLDRIDPSYRD
jgi:ribulose-5-phosphate 4-epimerase/fuculose-1-phosphate aldolase